MQLLVGDIGGTKTELALYDSAESNRRPSCSARYPSTEFESLEEVVKCFLTEHPHDGIAAAAFGVAGPIVEQRCITTNLPWVIEGSALSTLLGCPVRLLNDFETVALAMPRLQGDQLHALTACPPDPDGPMAVLGAGTGLGEAIMVPDGRGALRILPTEGGHCDLAARNDTEVALLRYLQKRFGRVSVERAVSGPGLAAVFDFVVDSHQGIPLPSTTVALSGDGDPGAIIGKLGLSREDPACEKALMIFVELYGAEAGNLALKSLPTGGLFIAGGIAPKILPALTGGHFMQALLDKGRMRAVLERLPIAIVLEPHTALIGARQAAAELAGR